MPMVFFMSSLLAIAGWHAFCRSSDTQNLRYFSYIFCTFFVHAFTCWHMLTKKVGNSTNCRPLCSFAHTPTVQCGHRAGTSHLQKCQWEHQDGICVVLLRKTENTAILSENQTSRDTGGAGFGDDFHPKSSWKWVALFLTHVLGFTT